LSLDVRGRVGGEGNSGGGTIRKGRERQKRRGIMKRRNKTGVTNRRKGINKEEKLITQD